MWVDLEAGLIDRGSPPHKRATLHVSYPVFLNASCIRETASKTPHIYHQSPQNHRFQHGRRSAQADDTRCSEVLLPPLSSPAGLICNRSAIFNDPTALQHQYPVPVCQCVQIKTLASSGEGTAERYRLVLSDADNFVQSMLATRTCQRILRRTSLIRLQRQTMSCTKES